jgi:hypothetical protein
MVKFALCTLSVLFSSGAVYAQENLGQVLDTGSARKLNGEAVRSVLVGSRATGPGLKNTSTDINFHQDGTVDGYISGGGRSVAITGNYQVADNGNICLRYEFAANFPPYNACVWLYQVPDQYYVAHSDTDRNAAVLKRTYTRK